MDIQILLDSIIEIKGLENPKSKSNVSKQPRYVSKKVVIKAYERMPDNIA